MPHNLAQKTTASNYSVISHLFILYRLIPIQVIFPHISIQTDTLNLFGKIFDSFRLYKYLASRRIQYLNIQITIILTYISFVLILEYRYHTTIVTYFRYNFLMKY